MKQQQVFAPPLVVAEQAGPSGALTAAAGPDAAPVGSGGLAVPAAFAGLRWRLLPDRNPARGHDAKP